MTTNAITTTTPSSLRRLAAPLAIATGVILIIKVTLILATANTVSETLTGVLYVTGVALPLVGAAAIAAGREGRAARVGTYVAVLFAHLFFIIMVSDGVGALVEVFTSEAYITDEVPIAVLGTAWLVAGSRMRRAEGVRSGEL